MKSSGYSGTPLWKKLGFKEGYKIAVINAPDHYHKLLDGYVNQVEIIEDKSILKNIIHFFTKEERELSQTLPELRNEIVVNGTIWVSWPKKSSKIATDITEDVVRNIALQNDLVDIKVCAVDEIWSGLKLVIPVTKR